MQLNPVLLAAILLQLLPSAEAQAHSISRSIIHSRFPGGRLAQDVRIALRSLVNNYAATNTTTNTKPKAKRCIAEHPAQIVIGPGSGPKNSSSPTSPATSSAPGSTSKPHHPSNPSNPSSGWQISQNYAGNSFFDGWDFWDTGDPTDGTVQYLDRNDAQNAGLIQINSAGNAVMSVETTPVVSGNRKSVRISTQASFTGGLVILDAVHMPTGCGTWPAFWSNGPDWPNNGEIDIVEGVNDLAFNQASIHTRVGCTINATNFGAEATLVGGPDCSSADTNNGGCGEQSFAPNNFGVGFNSNGGGVYAMLWDDSGIAVWFFPRQSIPSDITSSAPNPTSWGTASARWPSTNCNSFSFFNNHIAIFDTTLCGDWAGNVWNVPGGPGQEQSCAQRTGVATCAQFVANNGAAFAQAYWEVKSVKIYQPSS